MGIPNPMAPRSPEANLDLVAVSAAVDRYFAAFNAEDYPAIAALFEPDGVLLAPFESSVVGPDAILAYLQAEARGMRAAPLTVEAIALETEGDRRVVVGGRVRALLFSVNVQWVFELTAADRLRSVEIKLLASLQELMQLNRG